MIKPISFIVVIELLMDGEAPNTPRLEITSRSPEATMIMLLHPNVMVSTAFHVLASAASNLIDYMVSNGNESREKLMKEFVKAMEFLSTKDANDLLNLFKQQP